MPHAAIPLSDLGHAQARGLAGMLTREPSAVLVSAFVRTRQTAEPYCARVGIRPLECSNLNEFSVVDPALIEGLRGPERKPFVKAFWDAPDPHRRCGVEADTFAEFNSRVGAFQEGMQDLPDAAVIFGHGIWFGLLLWRLLGYSADDLDGMRAFRRFQQGFPMPNCAVFRLTHGANHWSVRANMDITRTIASVRVEEKAALEALSLLPDECN